ncbi:hypothetical protein Tco_1350405, partial [Tanacetum coccineum]
AGELDVFDKHNDGPENIENKDIVSDAVLTDKGDLEKRSRD